MFPRKTAKAILHKDTTTFITHNPFGILGNLQKKRRRNRRHRQGKTVQTGSFKSNTGILNSSLFSRNATGTGNKLEAYEHNLSSSFPSPSLSPSIEQDLGLHRLLLRDLARQLAEEKKEGALTSAALQLGYEEGDDAPAFQLEHVTSCQLRILLEKKIELDALVDTGAALTSISYDLVRQLGLQANIGNKRPRIVTAGGSTVSVLGELLLNFSIQDTEIQHTVFVFEQGLPMLLGMDFLNRAKAFICIPLRKMLTRYGLFDLTCVQLPFTFSAASQPGKEPTKATKESKVTREEPIKATKESKVTTKEPKRANSGKQVRFSEKNTKINDKGKEISEQAFNEFIDELRSEYVAEGKNKADNDIKANQTDEARQNIKAKTMHDQEISTSLLRSLQQASTPYDALMITLEAWAQQLGLRGEPDDEGIITWRRTAKSKTQISRPMDAERQQQEEDFFRTSRTIVAYAAAAQVIEEDEDEPAKEEKKKPRRKKSYDEYLKEEDEYPGEAVFGQRISRQLDDDDGQARRIAHQPDPADVITIHPEQPDEEILTKEFLEKAQALKDKYPKAFAIQGKPGKANEQYAHTIKLVPGAKPVRQALRQYNPQKKEAIKKQVDTWLLNDVIEEIPFAKFKIPLHAVPKPDGTIRVVLDSTQLNNVIEREHYPVPRTQELFDQLGKGAKWITKFDLKEAFLQIPLTTECRDYTSFETPGFGVYRFKRMPYGLVNAAEAFQEFIHRIVPYKMRCEFVANYIDDLLIYSSTLEEHVQHVETILQLIQDAGLTLKPSKCFFFRHQVKFLGHIFSRQGMQPDPERIQAIVDYKEPTDVSGVRRFLGMMNFVGRFIPDMARHAASLIELTRQNTKKINWDPERHGKDFKILKDKLIQAPVLIGPDFGKPFIIMADASDDACGAALIQDQGDGEKPVAYASHKFTDAEKRWTVSEREAYALYWSTRKFESYLKGSKITLRTDHKPIIWMRNCKNPCPKVYRWLLWLAEFDFTIEYLPGPQQYIADAISRSKPEIDMTQTPIPMAAVQLGSAIQWPEDQLRDEQRADKYLGRIIKAKANNEVIPLDEQNTNIKFKALMRKWDQISFDDKGIAYIESRHRQRHVILPECRKDQVFYLFHCIPTAGHYAFDKTCHAIADHYWWPQMEADIREMCSDCYECALCKREKKAKASPFAMNDNTARPFHKVSMDVNTMNPRTPRGNIKVLVITDWLTKWAEVYAIRDETADTIAGCFIDFVSRHGCPAEVLTDQGRNFESRLMKKILKDLGLDKLRTTAYHPQTNTAVERFNDTLNNMLKVFENGNCDTWDLLLPQIVFAYRTAYHSTIKMSPFEALYGRKPILPGRLLLGPESFPEPSHVFNSPEVLLIWRQCRENIQKARQRQNQAKAEAQGTQAKAINSGDQVLLRNYAASKLQKTYKGKWQAKFEAYPKAWVIQNVDTGETRTVSVDHIKLWKTKEELERQDVSKPIFPPTISERFDDDYDDDDEPLELPVIQGVLLSTSASRQPDQLSPHQSEEVNTTTNEQPVTSHVRPSAPIILNQVRTRQTTREDTAVLQPSREGTAVNSIAPHNDGIAAAAHTTSQDSLASTQAPSHNSTRASSSNPVEGRSTTITTQPTTTRQLVPVLERLSPTRISALTRDPVATKAKAKTTKASSLWARTKSLFKPSKGKGTITNTDTVVHPQRQRQFTDRYGSYVTH